MFRSAVVAMLLLVAPVIGIGAQVLDLQPGTRVRVRTPDRSADRVQGTVTATEADSVVIERDEGGSVRLAADRISSVELSTGRSSLAGMQSGARWGMGVTLPIAFFISNQGGGSEDPFVAAASGGLVVFGTLAGALIGAGVGKERWQRVDVPVRAVVARSADGIRIGMRMDW